MRIRTVSQCNVFVRKTAGVFLKLIDACLDDVTTRVAPW